MTIPHRPLLLACLLLAGQAWGDASSPAGCAPEASPPCAPAIPQLDPVELEKGLQALSWEQLVRVFQAVPKLKEQYDRLSDFERSILQQRYAHHAWRRNVAKLDDAQRLQLAELIEKIRGTTGMR
jgi:hypothetical protein